MLLHKRLRSILLVLTGFADELPMQLLGLFRHSGHCKEPFISMPAMVTVPSSDFAAAVISIVSGRHLL